MVDHRCDSLIVRTALGPLAVAVSERGVNRVEFNPRSEIETDSIPSVAAVVIRELQQYAKGQLKRFTVPIDLTVGTEFQRAVWQAMLIIPYGETRSYGWIARQIGRPRSTRAVGSACGANPVAVIIPCHRVIAGDGSLGGFGGGLDWKRRLLALEGGRALR